MKIRIRLVAIAMALAMFCSSNAFAGESHYLVQVEGMNCPFCAYGIEKQLEKLDGVKKVEVELARGEFWIEVDEGAVLSEDTVSEIAQDAGFTFKGMKHHEEPHSLADES